MHSLSLAYVKLLEGGRWGEKMEEGREGGERGRKRKREPMHSLYEACGKLFTVEKVIQVKPGFCIERKSYLGDQILSSVDLLATV